MVYLLNASSQAHDGNDDFRSVGLLPVKLREESWVQHHRWSMLLNICSQVTKLPGQHGDVTPGIHLNALSK